MWTSCNRFIHLSYTRYFSSASCGIGAPQNTWSYFSTQDLVSDHLMYIVVKVYSFKKSQVFLCGLRNLTRELVTDKCSSWRLQIKATFDPGHFFNYWNSREEICRAKSSRVQVFSNIQVHSGWFRYRVWKYLWSIYRSIQDPQHQSYGFMALAVAGGPGTRSLPWRWRNAGRANRGRSACASFPCIP